MPSSETSKPRTAPGTISATNQGSIPSSIEVDLAGTEIGDSIHIGAVPLPKGVVPTITDRDFTIVTLAAPTVQAVETVVEGDEDAEGEEAVEGEATESSDDD